LIYLSIIADEFNYVYIEDTDIAHCKVGLAGGVDSVPDELSVIVEVELFN